MEMSERTGIQYDIELKIFSREDRKTVMAILADNGYDVGQHKKQRTATGKAVDYYVHATLPETNTNTSADK
jgi:hypothetical protein